VNRDGIALIEVLAALVILSFAGLSSVTYVSAVAATQERAQEREAEIVRADRVLAEHALLTEQQLAQRIGARRIPPFVIWVDRPRPHLFRVGIAPEERPEQELLVSLLARPDSIGEAAR